MPAHVPPLSIHRSEILGPYNIYNKYMYTCVCIALCVHTSACGRAYVCVWVKGPKGLLTSQSFEV